MASTISGTKKATFTLRTELLAALDKAVAEGAAPSKNAFVERALVRELQEQQRALYVAGLEEASAGSSVLLKDLADVEQAFRFADAETTETTHP